jgi:hypothetical protein
MNAHASPLPIRPADASLKAVLAALDGHGEKPLHIEYGGGTAQSGYHITEVKAGSFVTLDCGANADAWQETILQVEDIPARDGDRQMTVRKFAGIISQVDRKVPLNADARLTLEIGPPHAPMQVFDVASVTVTGEAATLHLGPRPAICKPRHRAEQEAAAASSTSCCSPSSTSSCC